ncbi:alpha/beta hydrolase [Pseudomonas nitroreducens]|uniref:alpha/beta hydrolase n=1 Tax=Pseudomonas nitroreducens TaxID=46680 RepID=UPI00209EAA93|nr:hypothetical protein [Pseudomonas nitroreducens]MCP1623316.1 hypothetical protein [Pseudomonas nitroreducens]
MAKIIMLVHGLGGTADETWGKFPEFLKSDADIDFDVLQFGYTSPPLYKFWKRAPNITNIANALITELTHRCDIENDEIILAGHSLGGLIVRKALLRLKAKSQNHKIQKVCFFDTPHNGSNYANIGKYITFRNRHLKQLCTDAGELDDLNDQWVDQKLSNQFEILTALAENDDIVSPNSAKGLFREGQVETIPNTDHISIVKPSSPDDISYLVFKRFALKKKSVLKYKNAASRTLDEWQKIERPHSYKFVADPKRTLQLESLIDAISQKKMIIRLTGASGLGKSRLIIEAISRTGISSDEILIYDAPEYEKEIKASLRMSISDLAGGIAIVDNCSAELHEALQREKKNSDSPLSIITVGYSQEILEDTIQINLDPLSDGPIIELLTPILTNMDTQNIERVAKFSQGYPLLAVLLAEQYKSEGRLSTAVTTSSISRKLIDGDQGATDDEKNILSACALFDIFGVEGQNAREEANYIATKIANSNLTSFDRTISRFTQRQIIHRAGRYARLIPKPLALTLAEKWWNETTFDTQRELIESLPESLNASFCQQVSYLDSIPNVQSFIEKMCGPEGPFGQAELLLTEKGSRLFRELVEVNPSPLNNALYRTLSSLPNEKILDIKGDIRRNIVWGLEKVTFHDALFQKAATSLLLLASAENETWSNNATGVFSQLFQLHLSGTSAPPSTRFSLIREALHSENESFYPPILAALEKSVNTYGGSRVVGAEFQGTKAPLKEWTPNTVEDIINFWDSSYNIILEIALNKDQHRQAAIDIIGHSIRGMIRSGYICPLDEIIKKIITLQGRYWPSALSGIKDAIEYDKEALSEDQYSKLEEWLTLLSPDESNLPEKLKILVINPPWEHRKDNDSHYVDVAAIKAEELGKSLAQEPDELCLYLPQLLEGEQKQTYSFARALALNTPHIDDILSLAVKALPENNPNISFILGVFRAENEKSEAHWEHLLERYMHHPKLQNNYIRLVSTGTLRSHHLLSLLKLIKSGSATVDSADSLSYGSITDNIASKELAKFCIEISNLSQEGAWVALNILFMHQFSNKERLSEIRDEAAQIATSVKLGKDETIRNSDLYHWKSLLEALNVYSDPKLADIVTRQVLSGVPHGFNHGYIWHDIKPVLRKIAEALPEIIWPPFSEAILSSRGLERYWLQQLLDRETGLASSQPSVFSALPVELTIGWCSNHPDLAPAFTGSCIEIFINSDEKIAISKLAIELIKNFGDIPEVTRAISANMFSRGWSGSLVPYLKEEKRAFEELIEHPNAKVRAWAKECISNIEQRISQESTRDSEWEIGKF